MINIIAEIKKLLKKNGLLFSILWLYFTISFFSLILKIYIVIFILSWWKILRCENKGTIYTNNLIGSCAYRILYLLNMKKEFKLYIEIFFIYLIVFKTGYSLKSVQLSLKFLDHLKFSIIIDPKWYRNKSILIDFIKNEYILKVDWDKKFFFNKEINFKSVP